jgi:hypothetical protein
MAIALAALDANNITTETESDCGDEFLTESSENLFLRNLSAIIANSERTSAARENQLSVTEALTTPQPQLGYFLPISFTPKLHCKRFSIVDNPITVANVLFVLTTCRDANESSRSPTPLNQPNHLPPNVNSNHINSRSKRFSSPPYSDYGCDKVNSRNLNGKIGKRNIRSMNEAIEVLADQVEEENVVSFSFSLAHDIASLRFY